MKYHITFLKPVVVMFVLVLAGATCYAQQQHNFKKDPEKTNCHKLKLPFTSEASGIDSVEASSFRFTQQMTISRYKVPNAVYYYSCDGLDGYLIAQESKDKKVLYEKVPKVIWDEFLDSDDPIGFYKTKILPLKQRH